VPPVHFLAARDAHQRADNGLPAVDEVAVGVLAVFIALQDEGHGTCNQKAARIAVRDGLSDAALKH
jgi:hypothetical protein